MREQLVGELSKHGWKACLFGGAVRDVAINGPSASPRDLDIVVSGPSVTELRDALSSFSAVVNRFGGYKLHTQESSFDVWRLEDTWAFKQFPRLNYEFRDLPKTSFLTTEAIVVEMASTGGRGRQIFEHRFFQSILDRVVDVNLTENPFPASCVARALVTATRLGFDVAPKLAQYISDAFAHVSVEDVYRAQLEHYAMSYLTVDDIVRYRFQVRRWAESSCTNRFLLERPRQMLFPFMVVDPLVEGIVRYMGITSIDTSLL